MLAQLFPSSFGVARFGSSPAIEQREQLSRVVQVIARDAAEAEGVEVAEGHGGEGHQRDRDLVELGHVRILQVEAHAVRAHEHEEGERAGEEDNPQAAPHAQPLVREHVGDAVKSGPTGENFNGRRSLAVHVVVVVFASKIHDYSRNSGAWTRNAERQRMRVKEARDDSAKFPALFSCARSLMENKSSLSE